VSEPTLRRDSNEDHDQWFLGFWKYLTGPQKAWRRLTTVSLLWFILDIAWYGLSTDSPSALSTLAYDNPVTPMQNKRQLQDTSTDVTACKKLTIADLWNPTEGIDQIIRKNALRSILVVSIASIAGSLGCLLIINRFRRKTILIFSFLALAAMFAVAGGTLFITSDNGQAHMVTTIFYAFIQFITNLGPNTLIFVIGAEVFPTAYRGTMNGISASAGKGGAILIRGVVGATSSSARPLAIRMLIFIPLMLLAAALSAALPDVQHCLKHGDTEATAEEKITRNGVENGPVVESSAQPRSHHAQGRRSSDSDSSERGPVQMTTQHRYALASGKLKNMTLEEIAPSPVWNPAEEEASCGKGKGKRKSNWRMSLSDQRG